MLRDPWTASAEILYIPREAERPKRGVMTREAVKKIPDVLGTRERLIAQLVIISGMRPGEIPALMGIVDCDIG